MVSPNSPQFNQAKTVRAVFERGVFRPLDAVDLPERTTVDLIVNDATVFSPMSDEEWKKKMQEIREKIGLNTSGWTFNRDELYERD